MFRKAKEIEDIFKVLNDNKISKEAIERCLSVLALGKAKEIEKIFKVLKDNGISKDIIHNNLGFLLLNSLQEIQTIFTEGNVYLKRYMQLKGYYDKVISEAEIHEICKEKKVTEREFFEDMRGKDYLEIYEETVKRKGGIYIGKSFPIDENYTSDNAIKLMNIAKIVAKNFGYRYHMRDISELESQAIEIIISKCGDIVYNMDWNLELLERLIYSKAYNYLKINLRAKKILQDFSTLEIERDKRFSNDSREKDKGLDLTNWKINEEQENILRYISMDLENGYELSDAIKNVADMLNIDEEEILEEIEKIKEQNDKNKIRMGEEDELS